jgi:tRNA (adenine57-N1/adenine58-N1)-methyltransferase catalytic subunit
VPWNPQNAYIKDGDLVLMVGLSHKHFIVRIVAGETFQSHRGVIRHDDMIGQPYGSQIFSHNGSPFFLLQPALGDLLKGIRRNTQILYPKDIGFILVTMGIGPGQSVMEAGTGSGALTTALAYAVGPQGKVISCEARPEMQALARTNLERLGLLERVELITGNIADGCAESGVDALFLDLPNPFDYLAQVKAALKPGGFFGTILPTANQVIMLLSALRRNGYAFIDVCEVLLRYYKPEETRFRPVDRMVAHTGFLIFARPVILSEDPRAGDLLAETGLAERIHARGAADVDLEEPDLID